MLKEYDFIFAGGGMSALMLAYMICTEKRLTDCSLLIVEPGGDAFESKNICFWASKLPALPLPLKAKWDALTFGGERGSRTLSMAPFSYYCFDGAELQARLMQVLSELDRVTFIRDWVEWQEGKQVLLKNSQEEFRARQCVFDSRPAEAAKVPLWQHFLGWEIEITNGEEFSPEALTLMDFRVDQQMGPAFMYVLPFSQQRALFEITLMTSGVLPTYQYEAFLERYLAEHYPGLHYRLLRTEVGKIPMQMPADKKAEAGVIRLGIRGGMAKPTTGYTFMNSYRHARQIVACLCGEQTGIGATSSRFAFYDRLLLRIIRHSPQWVKPIMEALFYRNRYPVLLSFLAESTSVWQEVRLFLTLPWKPFLNALYHEYFRRDRRDEAQPAADRPVLYPARLDLDRPLEPRLD